MPNNNFNAALGNGVRGAINGGGDFTSLATHFASGAVSGIPVVGGLFSSGIELASSLFGGSDTPEARGGNLYDGLQKPGVAPLDANALTANDAQVFADGARLTGLYVQEINDLVAFDMSMSHNSWPQVVDFYRRNPGGLAETLINYNRANPYNRLRPHDSPVVSQSSAAPSQAQDSRDNGASNSQKPAATRDNGASNSKKPAATDKTMTYALIGGGALVVVIALILILKK